MIDTDKYEGHTPAPWDELLSLGVEDQEGWDALLELGFNDEARLLIADAPLILEELIHYKKLYEYRVERFREDRAEIERLREELNKQMEYIEWLEQFAPKTGEYNTSWEAYELAKGSEEE